VQDGAANGSSLRFDPGRDAPNDACDEEHLAEVAAGSRTERTTPHHLVTSATTARQDEKAGAR